MSGKVVITKSKLEELSKAINAKAGETGEKTIAQMTETVENINTLDNAPVWDGGDY